MLRSTLIAALAAVSLSANADVFLFGGQAEVGAASATQSSSESLGGSALFGSTYSRGTSGAVAGQYSGATVDQDGVNVGTFGGSGTTSNIYSGSIGFAASGSGAGGDAASEGIAQGAFGKIGIGF